MTQGQKQPRDRTSFGWNWWLLRYMASDDKTAFNDLVWSVGGSPPYGGISYEEAGAVYDLLESHLGPGSMNQSFYRKVERMLANQNDRLDVLHLFGCYDRIASAPDNISVTDVEEGLKLATKIGHAGVMAYFRSLQAELYFRNGDIQYAREIIEKVQPVFTVLAIRDAAYSSRAISTMKNAVAFTALDGDFSGARVMLDRIKKAGMANLFDEYQQSIGDPPAFPKDHHQISDHASDLLQAGESLKALEWFSEAENQARAKKDQTLLCGLLGDKAVAFRRIGNTKRAIATYKEAIELCQVNTDWINLSRWSQNLGLVYLESGNLPQAEPYLKQAKEAAKKSGSTYQISTAAGNYSILLTRLERFGEAAESIELALNNSSHDSYVREQWRINALQIYHSWGQLLEKENETKQALEAYKKAFGYADLGNGEEKMQAAIILSLTMRLYDRLNDIPSAKDAAKHAIKLLGELKEQKAVRDLENYIHELDSKQYRL
jgi:tetratricopeptide (TPR) repeat protein